jgi:hypothetical protein
VPPAEGGGMEIIMFKKIKKIVAAMLFDCFFEFLFLVAII